MLNISICLDAIHKNFIAKFNPTIWFPFKGKEGGSFSHYFVFIGS